MKGWQPAPYLTAVTLVDSHGTDLPYKQLDSQHPSVLSFLVPFLQGRSRKTGESALPTAGRGSNIAQVYLQSKPGSRKQKKKLP